MLLNSDTVGINFVIPQLEYTGYLKTVMMEMLVPPIVVMILLETV
jgi:hypothetical protein